LASAKYRGPYCADERIVHLAKVLTPENRHEMLPRFFHRSRREAMEIAAAILPAEAAPRREVVTTVRSAATLAVTREVKPSASSVRVEPAVQPAELRLAPPATPSPASPPAPPPPAERDIAVPVTAELSRLHVTVSRRLLEKLDAARAALSHARPGATAGEILEAGLDLVLAQHAKRKGLVEKPRKEPPPSKSDCVPAHVKRAVWARDGGRCQWPVDGGGICGSTLRIELDHVVPRARGGPSTVENTRLLCKVHNHLAARHAFGDVWMDRFTRSGAGREALGQRPVLGRRK